tara:strand:+ start:253 stop:519 length:267 start_codon:yes stop_codon:yes gene_type:complete
MHKDIFKVIYFLIILLFFLFIFITYFSKENINKIKKNRIEYRNAIEKKISDLPFLENNTENIIDYNYEKNEEKKLKKRYFWDLLKKDG